jgi:hypothetical protein
MSTNEVVHSLLRSRLLTSIRRPSFAGSGLPERLRSTAFALLGLTAAAGLALVAIFAQLSFPLLAPAPLPDEPTVNESVAAAEKATPGRSPVSVRPAHPARPARPSRISPDPSSPAGAAGSPGETPVAAQSGGAEAPAPAAVPGPSSGSKNGGGEVGGVPGGGSNPAPTAAPPAPPTPPPSPPPASQPASPVPAPVASPPAPPEPVAPGNSASPAAASHASERGVEASASSGHAG